MTTTPEPWRQMVVDLLLELKRKQYKDFSTVIDDLTRLADGPNQGVDEDMTPSLSRVLLLHTQRQINSHAILECRPEPATISSLVDSQPPCSNPTSNPIPEISCIENTLQKNWEPLRQIWEIEDVASWPILNQEQDVPEACLVFRTEGAIGAFDSRASLVMGFYNRSSTKSIVIDFGIRKCLVRPKEMVPAMQEYPLWLSKLTKEHSPTIVHATSLDFEIVCAQFPTLIIEESFQFSVFIGGQSFIYKDGKLTKDSSISKDRMLEMENILQLPLRLERRFVYSA